MAFTEDDATKRAKVLGEINVLLAQIAGLDERAAKIQKELDTAQAVFEKAVAHARSQFGTVNAETEKLRKKYAHTLAKLNDMLPVVDGVCLTVDAKIPPANGAHDPSCICETCEYGREYNAS